ncbi:hypothetical protein K402DRAFT_215314 [Aulographum hederae CBS 113979]|uniref:Uncharacterized protein n=1 Tax=Aulographum hederae CBS 113979 TaxID=1176131 RepID=A0A6G1GMM7_9PEZI|nr:hypothetical protein K402DRAFT_215314 [Aulographum hederae CBS 113979]
MYRSARITALCPKTKRCNYLRECWTIWKHFCVFTLPQAGSHGRIADDQWSGGSWIAWGTQNRETPPRRAERGRWEVGSEVLGWHRECLSRDGGGSCFRTYWTAGGGCTVSQRSPT